jgi:D-arabinan exo alpha-(1,3)/(1,5)-arabinofuranosidase (non-reducing end)
MIPSILQILVCISIAAADPPPSADLRQAFADFGLGPRVQGGRGTCSVFVVTGALEFALARESGHGGRLSVEFLNWASNQAIGRPDDGGFFSDLWKGFESRGICAEDDLPYRPEFSRDLAPPAEVQERASAARKRGLKLHWIKEWNPKKGLDEAQLAEVRRTIASGWPVGGGFLWPKREVWKKDVLQFCAREDVRDGHSVLLVGYQDDPAQAGGGLFTIRNSAHGGREGFLTYEYLLAYMNDAVWIEGPVAPAAAAPSGATAAAAATPAPVALGIANPFAAPIAGRNRRISSNQEPQWNDGDDDMKVLAPGEVLELPVLEGPGVITHLWFTSHAGWANELDSLSLRIFWDGRDEPGVEAPLGDFFAVGQGKPAPVDSFPVSVSPTGSLTAYWRMPFARSARIVLANENPDRAAGLYWQVDWVKVDAVSPDTPYFHARYRREHPAAKGRDYLIADLEGRGQYVGTVLSVTLAQDGWFGEGDDFFFIDGEKVPSLQGTGTEDYFNDAWGFRSRTGPWFGQPRWQGDRAGDSGVAYRWHILDPVNFTTSLQVAIEHKGNREPDIDGFYIERPDFLSSVAFWYQTGTPRAAEKMPSYPERRVPWRVSHLVKAFRKAQAAGGPGPRVTTEGLFGARPVLAWPAASPGARLTLPFAVEKDGRYALRLTAAGGPESGLHDIEIDGKPARSGCDFRSEEGAELDIALGIQPLSKGEHSIAFVSREAPGRPAGPLAVELLRLLDLPPEATREVKNDNEAHFIRLGIGRAVFAFRLAYGELPESLPALVEGGLLAPRFLSDENGITLESRRDGEWFEVESRGPGGWKHRWQGLDARR